MKTHLLTAGYYYYPSSGTDDWIDTFETFEEAKKEVIDNGKFITIKGHEYDWYEIIDLEEWIK